VSYRNAVPAAVIAAAKSAGLGGIEWSADTHAPHGDIARAEQVMIATLRAGLTVSAYGSFFRLGLPDSGPAAFAVVLETTRRLQAPAVRVWGGLHVESPKTRIADLAAESVAIADAAGKFGITVCIEPHERTSISTYETLADIIETAKHPFLKACWAQLPSERPEDGVRGAKTIETHLALAHIRNWTRSFDRHTIVEAEPCWLAVRSMAEYGRNSVLDQWALIEYLEDEQPETLKREADALALHLKG
jgi:hypothetical protein